METKECLYNQYNIIVQKQSNTQYKWMRNNQSGILVFSSEDLKERTSKLMKEYLFNLNVKSITKKPRIWKQIGMDPPDNIYLD